MSNFNAMRRKWVEEHREWNNQGTASADCECGAGWPCPRLADFLLLLDEVERLRELEQASYRAWEKAEAELKVVKAELSVARSGFLK